VPLVALRIRVLGISTSRTLSGASLDLFEEVRFLADVDDALDANVSPRKKPDRCGLA